VVATFAIIESYELRLQLSIPLLRDDKGHPAAWFQALNVPKVADIGFGAEVSARMLQLRLNVLADCGV
jgi:hypothetical protein